MSHQKNIFLKIVHFVMEYDLAKFYLARFNGSKVMEGGGRAQCAPSMFLRSKKAHVI